jgi:hypothetical protein
MKKSVKIREICGWGLDFPVKTGEPEKISGADLQA